MIFRVLLPHLGARSIIADSRESGHYCWQSLFGWHDCTPEEDAIIATTLSARG